MLDQTPWNAVTFGVTFLLVAFAAVVGAQSVRKARNFYSDILEKHRPVIAQKQRKAFAEGTSAFYHDFIVLFEPLRRVCREHREKYEPQLKVIGTTETSLAELERILAPVEKALSSRK
jgi:hypothetical protein